jgi:DNA-3-methyladenine glycosylase II
VSPARLVTSAPFHLEATARVLQRRPGNLVDIWREGRYLRVLPADGKLVLVEVVNFGTIDSPDIAWSIRSGAPSAGARVALERTIRKMLGLDIDAEPARRLVERQRGARATARALRGMRPPRFADLFEAFANVVPFQQLSLDAGVAIVGRLVDRFGKHLSYRGRRFHAFPTAFAIAEASIQALRACGLNLHKAHSLRHVANLIAAGKLTEDELSAMTANDAIGALTDLPGIGPWSAGLILLRGLGRLEVFPSGDVGAARSLRALLQLDSDARVRQAVERLGDSRGYLYFCSLGGNLLARGLIHGAPPGPP